MNRIVLGALMALVLVGIGAFWWQSQAKIEAQAPPSRAQLAKAPRSTDLPKADVAGLQGPAPPEAYQLTREQQRFYRYDLNRDGKITRTEMLSTRTDDFRKLDADHNNLLTFDEWAVSTASRFDQADANHDGILSPQEFATTRQKPEKSAARCGCRD
ncbi:MAG TPA: hypothetical protein VF418_02335 [Sphingomonadaceae bacterium]